MNTKIIFNTDSKLKDAAQKKARARGLTLTAVLNLVTRAFVDDSIHIDVIGEDIARARAEIGAGKGIPAEEVYRRLGIRK